MAKNRKPPIPGLVCPRCDGPVRTYATALYADPQVITRRYTCEEGQQCGTIGSVDSADPDYVNHISVAEAREIIESHVEAHFFTQHTDESASDKVTRLLDELD